MIVQHYNKMISEADRLRKLLLYFMVFSVCVSLFQELKYFTGASELSSSARTATNNREILNNPTGDDSAKASKTVRQNSQSDRTEEK